MVTAAVKKNDTSCISLQVNFVVIGQLKYIIFVIFWLIMMALPTTKQINLARLNMRKYF